MKATLRVDGGSRGNPGPSAFGFILEDDNGKIITTESKKLGVTTNNVAEYSGLIAGLIAARLHKITDLTVFSDSELMIKQVLGEYKVHNEKLRDLHLQVNMNMDSISRITYVIIRREDNQRADALVNEALDI